MKSLSVALLVCFSSSLVLASEISDLQLLKKSYDECNVTNPVQRNPVEALSYAFFAGEKPNLSHEEKCFIFCFLQKVHFLNENANIKNGTGLVKFTLHYNLNLVNYTDAAIALIFLNNRANNGIQDKCEKAFVIYYQYGLNIAALALASSLQQKTHVKDEVINTLNGHKQFSKELPQEVIAVLKDFDKTLASGAKYFLEAANAKDGNKTLS